MNAWMNKPLELRGKLDVVSLEHNTNLWEQAWCATLNPWIERGDVKDLTYSLLLIKKAGSGGRMTNFIAVISHGHGVILCELLKTHLVNLSKKLCWGIL